MTDTAFFDDMDALATELINDFGTPATLRRIVIGDVGADGKAPKVPTDFPSLAALTTLESVIRQLAPESQAHMVFKGPQAAVIGDHLIHAAVTWEVKDLKNVNPEGGRLMIQFLGLIKP